MATVDELLAPYVAAETVEEAEAALDALAGEPGLPEGLVGDCYDELATAAVEEGDVAGAARIERKAIEAGCRDRFLAREMLAWYLLESGDVDEGEALFADLRRQRPGDVELLIALGNARSAAGLHDAALSALDDAVATARLGHDAEALDMARVERRAAREHAGLPADDDDRLAPAARPIPHESVRWALAWFPPGERAAAVVRWPGLADDFADPAAYARGIEQRLRELRRVSTASPAVAPLTVEALERFAAERGLDPDSGAARSELAAELSRSGNAIAWPPGRNDPCWCASGRKYKRCCGT